MRNMSKGIVLLGEDEKLVNLARGKGYKLKVDSEMSLAFDKNLILTPGAEVPWDLLPAAWHFLDRWDAAVPLWRYGVNACDVGSKAERKRTAAIVRDLRVLLYSHELLFVRDNDAGRGLMAAFAEEVEGSDEKRLAFLRAFYRVKPRLCVLPRSWQAEIYARSKMDADALKGHRHTGARLVEVELSPGRFVKCHAGDEEKVKKMLARGRH
jgi:hypothetical protein